MRWALTSLLPGSLLCCCFLPKNIVYLITNLFYSAGFGFRKIGTFFLACICLLSAFYQTRMWPDLSWENPISQLASRESSQHSVDVQVGTRSPACSALPVAVTVKNESFWRHRRGDLYLARLWLKAEVLPSAVWACNVSASPSCTPGTIWEHRLTLCQYGGSTKMGLWHLGISHQVVCYQSIFTYLRMLQSDLGYSGSGGAVGCICIMKLQEESLGQGILTCDKHHSSPSFYCKMAISGWSDFPS